MQSLTSGLNNLSKHVRDFLTGSTESESPSAQSQSKSLESPTRSRRTTTAATPVVPAKRALSASMKHTSTNTAEIKQRIAAHFAGTFGEEIDISDNEGDNNRDKQKVDDDDDDVQEIPPPQATKRRTPTKRDVNESAAVPVSVTRIRKHQQPASVEEQQETGQILTQNFKDSDDSGLRPRRTNRSMPSGRSNGSFAQGGLRVTNTLDSNNTFTKSAYMKSKVSRTHDRSTLMVQKPPRPPQYQQTTSTDDRSPKRQRTQSPERRPEFDAQARREAQDVSSRSTNPSLTRSRQRLLIQGGSSRTESVPTNQPKDTALRTINQKATNKPNEGRKLIKANSPDYLFGTDLGDDDECRFTKDARRERQSRASDPDEDRSLQSELRSTRIPRNTHPPTDGIDQRDPNSSSRTANPHTTPVSKMAARLEESPDVLQIDSSVIKPKRMLLAPSKSPPLSRPRGISFHLERFIVPGLLEANNCEFELDKATKTCYVRYTEPGLMKDAIMKIHIDKVRSLTWRGKDGGSNLARLGFSSGVFPGNQCFLDFGKSEKTCADFNSLLQQLIPKVQVLIKEDSWIERALRHATADSETRLRRRSDEQTSENLKKLYDMDDIPTRSVPPKKTNHVRKVDQLDTAPASASHEQDPDVTHQEKLPKKHERPERIVDTEIPALPPRTRETRLRAVKHPQEYSEIPMTLIDVEPRRVGPAWQKPLIYPKTGKARATVTWDDLERLNDDEFLNDNIIGMFMRYLQEHMDPEVAKKTHFFSTYFYSSLTRVDKGKNRQINYAAVESWTKNVNLFYRDYVVVPVNENTHWYVMIICNLRSLKKRHEEHEDEDVVEIDDPSEEKPDEIGTDVSKLILESDLGSKEDFDEDKDYAEGPEDSKPASAKKRFGRRKSHAFRHRKYATNQPVIITLDSLGLGRSNTASALKDYIIAEANNREALTVEKKDIDGMTAKSIPLQGNFSDCGLYLCMYLEQFVRDPKRFVRSILQREEESVPWPKRLENGILRERLYQMLQTLYQTQAGKASEDLPQLGRILINDEDYNAKKSTPRDIYDPENVKAAVEFYNNHRQARENGTIKEDRMLLDDEIRPNGQDLHTTATSDRSNGSTSQPILVEDSQEQVRPQDGTSSRYFQHNVVAEVPPEVASRAETPMALAEKIRRARSPGRPPSRSHGHTNGVIDVSTPDSKVSPKKLSVSKQANGRHEREESCTTEFLTSDRTYREEDDIRELAPNNVEVEVNNTIERPDEMQGVEREDVFEGFGDDPRAVSVIPESVQGEDGDGDSEMLLQ